MNDPNASKIHHDTHERRERSGDEDGLPIEPPTPQERERIADECCLNCGRARWRHHYFSGFGLLCPSNKGAWQGRAAAKERIAP